MVGGTTLLSQTLGKKQQKAINADMKSHMLLAAGQVQANIMARAHAGSRGPDLRTLEAKGYLQARAPDHGNAVAAATTCDACQHVQS